MQLQAENDEQMQGVESEGMLGKNNNNFARSIIINGSANNLNDTLRLRNTGVGRNGEPKSK